MVDVRSSRLQVVKSREGKIDNVMKEMKEEKRREEMVETRSRNLRRMTVETTHGPHCSELAPVS